MWRNQIGNDTIKFAEVEAMMNRKALRQAAMASVGAFGILAAALLAAQTSKPRLPPKTGVQPPGVRHKMAELVADATFAVEGRPDWMAVTRDAVWVASSDVNHVVRLDAKTNQPGTIVPVAQPCAGLAVGFGSLWIPSCGNHALVRVDAETGAPQAAIHAGPADDEGGIAVGAGRPPTQSRANGAASAATAFAWPTGRYGSPT
jgi:streptogramin lyase